MSAWASSRLRVFFSCVTASLPVQYPWCEIIRVRGLCLGKPIGLILGRSAVQVFGNGLCRHRVPSLFCGPRRLQPRRPPWFFLPHPCPTTTPRLRTVALVAATPGIPWCSHRACLPLAAPSAVPSPGRLLLDLPPGHSVLPACARAPGATAPCVESRPAPRGPLSRYPGGLVRMLPFPHRSWLPV